MKRPFRTLALAALTGGLLIVLSGPAVTQVQTKQKAALEKFGVALDEFGEMRIQEKALTPAGEFKTGVPAKMAQLRGVRRVTALDLPAFGAGAGKAVAAVPGVTTIQLWRTKATDEAIAALGGCPTLERVDLNNGSSPDPAVTDAGLAGLSKLKNVTDLTCRGGTITGKGLEAIAGFSKLETLDLEGCPVDDAAGPHLAKLTSLKELSLSGSKLTGAGLAALKTLPKLRVLKLDGAALTDADVKALTTFPGLTSLSLARTKVTDAGLAPLAAMPGLGNLELGGTAVTDAGMAVLAKSASLAAVDVHDTKVTDAGVAALAKLPKLRVLTLFRLPLTDTSLDALAKAPDLQTLWLADNKFTDAGIAKFKAARPKVSVIK